MSTSRNSTNAKRSRAPVSSSGKSTGTESRTPIWSIGLVIFATLLLSSGQVLLKRGLGSGEGLVWPLLIAGFFAYGIAGVLVTVALKFGDLSVLYPFIALGFVWVTLASIWLLSERLLWTQVLGVVVIISGVSLVGRGAK